MPQITMSPMASTETRTSAKKYQVGCRTKAMTGPSRPGTERRSRRPGAGRLTESRCRCPGAASAWSGRTWMPSRLEGSTLCQCGRVGTRRARSIAWLARTSRCGESRMPRGGSRPTFADDGFAAAEHQSGHSPRRRGAARRGFGSGRRFSHRSARGLAVVDEPIAARPGRLADELVGSIAGDHGGVVDRKTWGAMTARSSTGAARGLVDVDRYVVRSTSASAWVMSRHRRGSSWGLRPPGRRSAGRRGGRLGEITRRGGRHRGRRGRLRASTVRHSRTSRTLGQVRRGRPSRARGDDPLPSGGVAEA